MNTTQKLTAYIECGVKHEWELGFGGWEHFEVILAGVGFWDGNYQNYVSASLNNKGESYSIPELIFNHQLAQAALGNQLTGWVADSDECEWQYHLQQAVLLPTYDEQIDYLYQNMRKD